VKSTFWFVTYNGMGGHPVLSFAPDLLLPAEDNSFGEAVGEIESCAHVEPAHGPPPESDFLMGRFRDRLPTLPMAWLRRKKRRIEIAYLSHLGCAEELLGGDFAAKKIPDVALLRRACAEVAASFAMIEKCFKRSDDFDFERFIRYVDAKAAELTKVDDRELLLRLARAAERSRMARAK
jgi:hypothetical protein